MSWRRRRRRRRRRRSRRRRLSFCPSTALLLRSHGSLIPLYEKDNSDAQRGPVCSYSDKSGSYKLPNLLMNQNMQSNLFNLLTKVRERSELFEIASIAIVSLERNRANIVKSNLFAHSEFQFWQLTSTGVALRLYDKRCHPDDITATYVRTLFMNLVFKCDPTLLLS